MNDAALSDATAAAIAALRRLMDDEFASADVRLRAAQTLVQLIAYERVLASGDLSLLSPKSGGLS
jgi:HEAT repeat protein